MKKKIFALVLAATMVISTTVSAFAETGWVTAFETKFDNATGVKGFTSSYLGDEKNYNFVETDASALISDGAFKPNATAGVLLNGTYDFTEGFKITATVKLPAEVSTAATPWFRQIAVVINSKDMGGLTLGSEQTGKNFTFYSLNSNGSATGFQAHADVAGGDDTWGGDGVGVDMDATHVVTYTVTPNADNTTVTVSMTVDGEEYAIPNGNAAAFPNYLSDSMQVIVGNSMYGDAYMYDILDIKVEKIGELSLTPTNTPTETPTTGDVTTVLPIVLLAVAAVVAVYVSKKKPVEE